MEPFESLGLSAALTEALATEGIESPSELQTQAIPVLCRGSSAVLRSGPGAGVLVTYGAAILERVSVDASQPRAFVVTGSRTQADALAESLARLGSATGHRVAALGSPWAFPERAQVLFSTIDDLDGAVREGSVKVDEAEIVVLTLGPEIGTPSEFERVRAFFEFGDQGAQCVVVAEPVTDAVRRFVDDHLRRAVYLPPDAATGETESAPVERGTLTVIAADGDDVRDRITGLVSALLNEDCAHVLTFVRSEDGAADLGDLLTLRGFLAGAPGDSDAPVWLGTDPVSAREARGGADGVAVISIDVPADPDELDRRHGGADRRGFILAHPRELPHLERIGRAAGYVLEPGDPPTSVHRDGVTAFLDEIEEAIEREDLGAYLTLLDPLIRRRGAVTVAAAIAGILRRRPSQRDAPEGSVTEASTPATGGRSRPPSWVKLFVSVGTRDGVGAGDLLGAIAGETGLAGEQVGRIEVRDTFSRVDVQDSVAEKVIRAVNGTSIRGRSVRVDFDRVGARPRDSGEKRGDSGKGRRTR